MNKIKTAKNLLVEIPETVVKKIKVVHRLLYNYHTQIAKLYSMRG